MTISLKANAAGTQGEIFLNGSIVQTFNQNTLQVSGNVLAGAAQNTDPSALTRKDYVDTKVSKSGDTITGNFAVTGISGFGRATKSTSTIAAQGIASGWAIDCQVATNGNGVQVYQSGDQSAVTSRFAHLLADDVTTRFRVAMNGNAQNTNNSWGGTSDVKLKTNIVDATPKLNDICRVRVVNYSFKTAPEQKQIGVIAQELESVFPSLVEETPDVSADGVVLETTTKSVKYSVFVPMLIKAIQELKAEFDAYKAAHP